MVNKASDSPARRNSRTFVWTRRQALQGLAIAAGAAWAGRVRGSQPPPAEKWIDAHSHIWTRDVQRYPLAKGVTVDALDPPSFTAEELLRVAQPEGVAQVVLIAHHQYYAYDNTYLIDAARRLPGTFRVVGMIDETQPDPAGRMKRLLTQGVTGFRIVPWIRQERWLDNPGMRQMWKTAAETGQAICCLINPENLAEVDRFCVQYPDTRVVIDHFARIGADGQVREAVLKKLQRLARHRNTYLKISAYYALGAKQAPYHDLVPMIRRMYE